MSSFQKEKRPNTSSAQIATFFPIKFLFFKNVIQPFNFHINISQHLCDSYT